jgi:hypothetical protein
MKKLLNAFVKTICYVSSLLFSLFFISAAHAQNITQNIRGTVVDKVSQSPIIGANVVVINSSPIIGSSTNIDGSFVLKNIAIGRVGIKITYMGYKELVIPNVTVNAGKEVVLNLQIEEDITTTNEVVVKSQVHKNKPLNEMATVSTRTFSVEETQKFAAAVNDPARMATSFAGVVGGTDGNNIIAIRGNSPNGLLWRMEGVEIPNPNHFSNVGTSGGGISILSAQLLGNSDFMTGAFASEYGNALSGVFDLKLRKGNNQKREHTFQAGVLGFDLASEGPIKKGYDGSYLINYRYSTLSVLGLMGLDVVGDATTNYQDLSFNISLPTKKYGNFGVFGLGGLSSQVTLADKDSILWKEESFKRYPSKFIANTGAIGLNNTKLLGRNTAIKTTLLFSGTQNSFMQDKLNYNYQAIKEYEQVFLQNKVVLSTNLTHKINAKNNIRTGFIISRLGFNLNQKKRNDSLNALTTFIQNQGNTATVQGFAQWNHKVSNRLSTNLGLHTLYLALNNTYSLEPRASVKYDLSSKQYVALGYGLHSQMQPIGTYFAKSETTGEALNKNIGLTRAHHLVLSHDINVTQHTHIKTEVYYQHLFDVPVSVNSNSTFSMLNEIDGFATQQLVNKGYGKNYGLELTVERFLNRNFYYLLSASLYESKFKALNGTWYDTRFNTNYATTFTAGKEWELSEKRKKKVIGINTKIMYVGGFRNTPIDLSSSINKGEVVYVESKPFTLQNADYFRIDVRFSIKRNFAKSTSTLSLDLQNATNRANIGGQYFDETSLSLKNWYQAGMIPVLAYKIEF